MRAVLLRDDIASSDYIISDDRAHHLIKSCRIKIGEKIKVISGCGLDYIYHVDNVTKREVCLKLVEEISVERKFNIDILFGLPKKEAFELAVKNAVEVGVRKFIPWQSQFSQWTIKNPARVETIIESSTIQANNSFVMEMDSVVSGELDQVINKYDKIILTTLKNKSQQLKDLSPSENILIVIGPEGGLSESEEDFILNHEKTRALNLQTNILRAPNALTATFAFAISRFDV